MDRQNGISRPGATGASSVKMLSFPLPCPPPGTQGSASSLSISDCARSPSHTPTYKKYFLSSLYLIATAPTVHELAQSDIIMICWQKIIKQFHWHRLITLCLASVLNSNKLKMLQNRRGEGIPTWRAGKTHDKHLKCFGLIVFPSLGCCTALAGAVFHNPLLRATAKFKI